ncbi:hypothetical protein GQ457_18G020050 [Hibiscus cannabinus]
MVLDMPAPKAAEVAIGSIGCGYDIVMDVQLKNCKGNNSKDSCLLEFDEDGVMKQFNREISLTGVIPSGLFNSMFEFSGCWQNDAANTKTVAFDGVFDTVYSFEMDQYQVKLQDHVKKAIPPTWEPAALARFIGTYGTHIIVGVKMGGKDVICIKQQHSSTLEPADIQKRLMDMADKRFVDANGSKDMSEQVFQGDKVCNRTVMTSP